MQLSGLLEMLDFSACMFAVLLLGLAEVQGGLVGKEGSPHNPFLLLDSWQLHM